MSGEKKGAVGLARTLGVSEVALLGIGALLGGGIFTLLGHVAGLAGGGLVIAMLLGALLSFLNLNAYVALATTFPAAGGGYHWVRDGLGDIQGFLSGWCSWMASATACALYAVSFGVFLEELVFDAVGFASGTYSPEQWATVFALLAVLFFGFVNYRGVALSGKLGGAITVGILSLLGLFIAFGMKKVVTSPELVMTNLTPFFPGGLFGVLSAAALFYIAFEGSEIQAQTGEEVKNPAHVLKVGLFISWAVVSILYILIAFIVVAATDAGANTSSGFLESEGARAIIVAAEQFLPGGYILMLIAGLCANMAALNATIYSSSRVVFAMARDKFVWTKIGIMHPINFTPGRAILLSVAIIAVLAVLLPLRDIASAADMLFIALFLQLNLAYIALRRTKPEAKWRYIVPGGVLLPLTAVGLYLILGVALFHVSPLALTFLVIWILVGLVNYLGYAKHVEREEMAREIVYEHSARFHPKSEYRVVLPVGTDREWHRFSEIAYAMTRREGGDLIALRIHEMAGNPSSHAFKTTHDKQVLGRIEEDMTEKRVNVETRIVASLSVTEAILETIAAERADLVLMNFSGSVDTKGFIFGRKVDVVLRRAKCDMLTVKLGEERATARVLIPVAIDENPNLRFTGKVAAALHYWYGSTITVGMVVPEDVQGEDEVRFRKVLADRIAELKMKIPGDVEALLIKSDYLTSGILKVSSDYDVILLPAARGRITKAIGVGSVPEQVAKYCKRKTVIIAKGYRGITQPFSDYIKERFS